MTEPQPETCPPETRYTRPTGYAEDYRDGRFLRGAGPRTDRRERRAITALLARCPAVRAPWLDLPSGAGRLSGLLPRPVVQVDRHVQMLVAAGPDHDRVCARATQLPFADDAFHGALCMRLLHHIPSSDERTTILSELRRVTDGPIIASFFDSLSLQHWRRALSRRIGRKPTSGRCAIPMATMRRDLEAAGLRLIADRPLLRFVSEQRLVLAVRG